MNEAYLLPAWHCPFAKCEAHGMATMNTSAHTHDESKPNTEKNWWNHIKSKHASTIQSTADAVALKPLKERDNDKRDTQLSTEHDEIQFSLLVACSLLVPCVSVSQQLCRVWCSNQAGWLTLLLAFKACLGYIYRNLLRSMRNYLSYDDIWDGNWHRNT